MTNSMPVVDTAPIPQGKLFVDVRGKRYGRLTVYGYAGQTPFGQSRWHCICECGARRVVTGWVLASGSSQSCGCLRHELSTARKHKHGMNRSPEHHAWKNMKQRCLNKNYREWHYYGGRGITVHEAWRDDFLAFFKHIGPRPSPRHSLDRINNNGNYEPGNVRWAERSQQSRNRRNAVIVEVDGKAMHLADAVRVAPVTMASYRSRIKRGWSRSAAITTPPISKHRRP